ncbi:hypothetical protein [Salinicola socius]|uniref:Uncharacterized protein n=1 Tax=Salinicola socius TaxID=404433 RepID=A0A1Q8SUJ2_9GAMM|nr:hypothetical protein [Salinicola socius]OLO05104.1 hypothetical protein BTW07_05685 [Salinicola socius]
MKNLQRIRTRLVRIVPPIERWPTWLVSVMGLMTWLVYEHQQLMQAALLGLLVPATLAAGFTTEAMPLWAFVSVVAVFIAQMRRLLADCYRVLAARGY